MSCLFYGFGKIWNTKVKLGLVVVAWQGLLIVLMMACAQYSQDLTHSHIGLSPTYIKLYINLSIISQSKTITKKED
jgi:hypothetical protein